MMLVFNAVGIEGHGCSVLVFSLAAYVLKIPQILQMIGLYYGLYVDDEIPKFLAIEH